MGAAGCVLATPTYDIPTLTKCGTPVAVSVDWALAGARPGPPVRFATDGLFGNVSNLDQDGAITMNGFPGSTDDVDQLLLQVVVDAGGDHGVRFVVALPVVQESESEYSFPEGPIVIEGDRCPLS